MDEDPLAPGPSKRDRLITDHDRVIGLVDMDCFYAQVEVAKNPALAGKPLIVCQHGSKSGILLSVNYEARKFGVKRGMTIKEAKEACPEVHVAHVAKIDGLDKGDLSCYREASDNVFQTIFEFCGDDIVVEKASIDEAFLDLTKRCEEMAYDIQFREEIILGHTTMFPSTYVVSDEKSTAENRCEQLRDFFLRSTEDPNRIGGSIDVKLCAGAHIMEKLREQVLERTSYRCSAGIATNKMLAKLVASRHKPDAQTLLPLGQIESLLTDTPIKSIRFFGGKFGSEICNSLKVKTVGDLRVIPNRRIVQVFPACYLRILNIIHGHDSELVVDRRITNSVAVAKNLWNEEKGKLMEWIKGLVEELIKRLEYDQIKNERCAQNVEIAVAPLSGSRFQRSFNIQSYRVDPLLSAVTKFFAAFYKTDDVEKWTPGVRHISLNAVNFRHKGLETSLISDYFLSPQAVRDSLNFMEEKIKQAEVELIVDLTAEPKQWLTAKQRKAAKKAAEPKPLTEKELKRIEKERKEAEEQRKQRRLEDAFRPKPKKAAPKIVGEMITIEESQRPVAECPDEDSDVIMEEDEVAEVEAEKSAESEIEAVPEDDADDILQIVEDSAEAPQPKTQQNRARPKADDDDIVVEQTITAERSKPKKTRKRPSAVEVIAGDENNAPAKKRANESRKKPANGEDIVVIEDDVENRPSRIATSKPNPTKRTEPKTAKPAAKNPNPAAKTTARKPKEPSKPKEPQPKPKPQPKKPRQPVNAITVTVRPTEAPPRKTRQTTLTQVARPRTRRRESDDDIIVL